MINIQGTAPINDSFYRYKRNSLILENSSNGTNILNLNDIAKDINTTTKNLITYLKKKIGCQIILSKNNNTTYICKKKLEKDVLENVINDYCQDFIICKVCNLPELENNICNACGNCNTNIKKNKKKKKNRKK